MTKDPMSSNVHFACTFQHSSVTFFFLPSSLFSFHFFPLLFPYLTHCNSSSPSLPIHMAAVDTVGASKGRARERKKKSSHL